GGPRHFRDRRGGGKSCGRVVRSVCSGSPVRAAVASLSRRSRCRSPRKGSGGGGGGRARELDSPADSATRSIASLIPHHAFRAIQAMPPIINIQNAISKPSIVRHLSDDLSYA